MSRPREDKAVNGSKVAQILTDAINKSSKTQTQIAREVGFNRPNMVSMIKQGHSRVPLDKIKRLADCLELDAKDLLDSCMQEYRPEEWAVIKEICGIEPGHGDQCGNRAPRHVDARQITQTLKEDAAPAPTTSYSRSSKVAVISASVAQAEATIVSRLERIKPGNGKLVGFQTNYGRHLALQRDVRCINVWTEDLAAPQQFAPFERYPAHRSRHSNLASQAPRLGTGNDARKWRLENTEQLEALVAWYAQV